MSYARFIQQVRREVATLLAQSDCGQDGVITDQMLEGLPEPARRYLAYSGVVGRPRVRTVYLTQKGRMRAGEQLPWLPLDARQWYSVSPPGFVWDGRLHLGPLPIARARDLYLHGRGSLAVRAAQAIPVADSAGAEMDQGAMLRYLAEMIWFPAALLEANVSFAPIDGRSIRVTLTDNGRSVSGTLHIDEAGRLLRFDAERYRMVDGGFQLCHWSAVVTEYGEFEGLKLPTRAQALWHLEKGDLPYFDVGIEELRYR
ncbi:MAG TPA: DUF6544 family protein [Thermomicrobiaceae bacterium]|nr:DUF6544 family protein [Thermomicrobiaceae bacterium]